MFQTFLKFFSSASSGSFFRSGIGPFAKMGSAAGPLPEPDIPVQTATFAMGCFWAPEPIFGGKKGVIRTKVGYTGGTKLNPTYRSLGDHTEAIQIEFDPSQTDYKAMLDVFFKEHDPTAKYKTQYKSAIYVHDEEQEKLAKEAKESYQKQLNRPIVTEIHKFDRFYDAEDYHQKYHLREHTAFYDSLKLTDAQLIRSHVATRINGYLYGYGDPNQFESDAAKWGLSADQIAYIKKQMASPRAISCGL